MAGAFASVDDVRAAYPKVATDDARTAQVLALVSTTIRALADTEGIAPDVLRTVAVQASARVLQAGTEAPIGATSTSWTASPYGGSTTFANPTSDIYFTALEKRMLGIDDVMAVYINQEVGE